MKFANQRKIRLLLIDSVIAVSSYYIIALIGHINPASLTSLGSFTVVKLLAFLACLFAFRLAFRIYSFIWRYANADTYSKLIAADGFAALTYLALTRFIPTINPGFAYCLLLSMTTFILTLCSRYIYQGFYAYRNKRADEISTLKTAENNKINVVIVGAGNVGALLAGTLLRNPKSHYNPYAFVDNDPQKVGNAVNGIRVYFDSDTIVDDIKKMPVQEVIIAIPDMTTELKERLYTKYKATGCKVKLYDYPTVERGVAAKGTIREFRIEDLLFRDSITLSNEKVTSFYTGKIVMVTGGGGSIGSELCRQIAKQKPRKLIILDIYENNAYEIQQDLLRQYGHTLNLVTVIASVRDKKRLEEVFRHERPEIVIHAAAHKHVPLMEESACEAIKNNVMGTYNCAELSEKYHVKKFLLISTDKAVNPTNVMGASKRLCEMVIQCREDSNTVFSAVRFGNVLGSNGSVIPLFKKQIENGGPVTITDKRIIRYFMTISEAVQLVLEAGVMASNGELFVLDMGKPVKIINLAENMIRLSGYEPYQDIQIKEIGLRPGEKLYEELLMSNQKLKKTENDLIFVEQDEGYSRAEMQVKLNILLAAVETEGYEAIVDAIKHTVPTYHDPDEVNGSAEAVEEKLKVAVC